jgi:hypothetical protein
VRGDASKEATLRHSPRPITPNYGLMLALALAGWAALAYLIVSLVS